MDEITTVAGSHLRGFRGVAGESRLRPRLVGEDCTTRYFLRCRTDGYVEEVIVYHPVGEIFVFTNGENGEQLRWGCRDTGDDRIVFYPHPSYTHTLLCMDCNGEKVVGIDPVTNPSGSKCQNCEGSGRIPRQIILFTERNVVAERIYLEPTTVYSFAGAECPSTR